MILQLYSEYGTITWKVLVAATIASQSTWGSRQDDGYFELTCNSNKPWWYTKYTILR